MRARSAEQFEVPRNPFIISHPSELPQDAMVVEFVEQRMAKADSRFLVEFTDEALILVGYYSDGNPTLINAICGWSFLLAFRDGVSIIETNLINEAAFHSSLLQDPGGGTMVAQFPEGSDAVDFLRREHRIHDDKRQKSDAFNPDKRDEKIIDAERQVIDLTLQDDDTRESHVLEESVPGSNNFVELNPTGNFGQEFQPIPENYKYTRFRLALIGFIGGFIGFLIGTYIFFSDDATNTSGRGMVEEVESVFRLFDNNGNIG